MLSNFCILTGNILDIHKSSAYAIWLISLPPKWQPLLLFDKVKLKSSI